MPTQTEIPESDLDNVNENMEDESDIITDQDETVSNEPDDDEMLGAESSDSPPLADDPRFVRGEVDVKDQMDHAIRVADKAMGRDPQQDILEDEESEILALAREENL